jgi:hypothetical protein
MGLDGIEDQSELAQNAPGGFAVVDGARGRI